MNVTSRYGVSYNLLTSPYVAVVDDYEFCFSTEANKRKFLEKLVIKREWLNDSMQRRFKFNIDFELLATFHWYRQCETRGFCIKTPMDEVYEWPENITFHGLRVN